MHLQACIFDFDGVIVDSEPLQIQASRLTLERFGIAYPDTYYDDFVGRADADFFRGVTEQLDAGGATVDEMLASKRQLYEVLSEEVQLVPGVEAFLHAARRAFGKVGLATSATRREVETSIRRFHMGGWFDAIVSVEDTARRKPDPEPYRKIVALLGVEPAAALVIEDSPSGVIAGRAAGCFVAGLATSYGAEPLAAAGANIVAGSFRKLGAMLGLPD
jgi:beta-phosphoglucomutase